MVRWPQFASAITVQRCHDLFFVVTTEDINSDAETFLTKTENIKMNSPLHAYFADLTASRVCENELLCLVDDNARVARSHGAHANKPLARPCRWDSSGRLNSGQYIEETKLRVPTRRRMQDNSSEVLMKSSSDDKLIRTKREQQTATLSSLLLNLPYSSPAVDFEDSENIDIGLLIDDVTSYCQESYVASQVDGNRQARKERSLSPYPQPSTTTIQRGAENSMRI